MSVSSKGFSLPSFMAFRMRGAGKAGRGGHTLGTLMGKQAGLMQR